MSSTILSPVHFNSVENSLINFKNHFKFNSDKEIKNFVDAIRMLSVKSVHDQYGTAIKESISIHIDYLLHNKKAYYNLSLIELYKALVCIDYQIEMDSKKMNEVELKCFNILTDIINVINDNKINTLPEYQNAKWFIGN